MRHNALYLAHSDALYIWRIVPGGEVMAKERFRLQFKFWLDVNKPDEYALAETIAELKENKIFSGVVRDGIRLAADLCRGNLDVLLSLFPWVEEAFYERFQEQHVAPDQQFHEQLARLERLLVEQGNMSISESLKPAVTSNNGPKPMTFKDIAEPAPNNNNDYLLITTKAAASDKAAQNFLTSALSLQQ